METYQLLIVISSTREYCGHITVSLQAIWLRQIAINLYVCIMRIRAANANHDRHWFQATNRDDFTIMSRSADVLQMIRLEYRISC